MLEAVVNVCVGYGVAVGSQMVVFPLLEIEVAIETNLIIGLIFTVISLVRSYILRRIFTTMGWFRNETSDSIGPADGTGSTGTNIRPLDGEDYLRAGTFIRGWDAADRK
jgi:hypothetical protein